MTCNHSYPTLALLLRSNQYGLRPTGVGTCRLTGTYNPDGKSTDNLLGGLRNLRWLVSAVIIGVVGTKFPEPPSRGQLRARSNALTSR